MCGIFGHTIGDSHFDISRSRRALETLSHRGPDQWNDWHNEFAYLGHRRLSILDLSKAGCQPMSKKRTDGSVVVMTANGEIWNFNDCRKELEQAYNFKSKSDSEVLLYGYMEWGLEGLLERIDGMFAFSIYDSASQKLYIVRDRYGIKPLYYVLPEHDAYERFLYASEIKALFDFNDDLRYFSKSGVVDWLAHRGSYSGLTPYHGVMKLLPGHYLSFDLGVGDAQLLQYYELLDYVGSEDSEPAAFASHFKSAIDKRLMSDVPVGLQLSGGIDSSLVALKMRELKNDRDLNSFSIGFKEAREQHLSEEPYARFVADKIDLNHHQINIARDDIKEHFEHVLWLADGMLDFPNTIPIYLLSRYSKDLVTVQLTGEGADELFGGYTKFQRIRRLLRPNMVMRFVPDFVIKLISGFKAELARRIYLAKYFGGRVDTILDRLNCYISPESLELMFGKKAGSLLDGVYAKGSENRTKFENLSFDRKLLVLDHKTYLHAVLERQDRASMGASIETRVPFLDRGLIEWALNLPMSYLLDGKNTKKILKDYASDKFGREFAYRRKVGFPMPIQSWMKDDHGLLSFYSKINDEDFLFKDQVKAYKARTGEFEHVLLNYGDPESQWVDWFMMVLRGAQDCFDIKGVKP